MLSKVVYIKLPLFKSAGLIQENLNRSLLWFLAAI